MDEASTSRRARSNELWEPDWISGNFISSGHCENPRCGQVVTSTGRYTVAESTKFEVPQYSVYFRVEFFSPSLRILPLPEDVPEGVEEATERAGRTLFVDPGLAATALRSAVERFLTNAGIPSERTTGAFLTLDRRLKEWRKETGHDRAADLFLAVKWIGNRGTHEASDLSVNDVIDGLEFIDEAFHTLFTAPSLDARARFVNERRGRRALRGSPA